VSKRTVDRKKGEFWEFSRSLGRKKEVYSLGASQAFGKSKNRLSKRSSRILKTQDDGEPSTNQFTLVANKGRWRSLLAQTNLELVGL